VSLYARHVIRTIHGSSKITNNLHFFYDMFLRILNRTYTYLTGHTFADINTSPSFTNIPTTVPVNENVASGTSVYTVSIVDNDGGQTHTFSLGPNSYFEMADPSSTFILIVRKSC